MDGNFSDDAPAWPGNALPRGTVLENYRIEGLLGTGGFGITYLARDRQDGGFALKEYFPRDFARRLGLGVLPATPADTEMFMDWRERFRNEARVLFRLSSEFAADGIVRARGFFEANGTCYLLMDHVPGRGLGDLLRKTPDGLAVAAVHSLLLQLLAILRIVHNAGLMHRDIKPENIIVRDDGGVVLIDFGSSREMLKPAMHEDTRIFSPRHAPPEQMMRGLHQGTFSDIYAIGAVCYQAIGGQTVEAHERHNAAVAGKPDPQDTAERVGAGRYPPALLRVIDAALRIDPARRPENVEAMFAALDPRQTEGETTIAAPPPAVRATPAPLPARARPAPGMFLAGGGILALAGMAGFVSWMLLTPSPSGTGFATVPAAPPSSAPPSSPPPSSVGPSSAFPAAVPAPAFPSIAAPPVAATALATSFAMAPVTAPAAAIPPSLVMAPVPSFAPPPAPSPAAAPVPVPVLASPATAPFSTAAMGPAAPAGPPAVRPGAAPPAIDLDQHWDWCIAQGDPDRSITGCTVIIEAGPGRFTGDTRGKLTTAFTNRGAAYLDKDRGKDRGGDLGTDLYKSAIEDFDKAIALTPEFADALISRCWAQAVIKQLQQARAGCDEAVRLASRDADAHDSRGFLNLRLQLMKDAIRDYTEALRLNPDMPDALLGRGLAHKALNMRAQSRADIDKALRKDAGVMDRFRRYGVVP